MIVLHEMAQAWSLSVNMLDGLVDTVLSNVVSRENKSILIGHLKWHSIMAIIHLLECELFEVSDESVPHVSFWHVKCRVFVVFYVEKIKRLDKVLTS